MSDRTPHPHAEIIKAWADGIPVQFKLRSGDQWIDLPAPTERATWPTFNADNEYRIKPKDPVVKWLWAVEFDDGLVHLCCRFSTDSSDLKRCFTQVKRFTRLDWTRTEFPQD